jgi:hypothetical protein
MSVIIAVRLTWDGVETLGTLTSDSAAVGTAFVSARAFWVAVASFNACCVEQRERRTVRAAAGLHVLGRQTSVYTLEQRTLRLPRGPLPPAYSRQAYTSHEM